jgi:WD40 repeat protein
LATGDSIDRIEFIPRTSLILVRHGAKEPVNQFYDVSKGKLAGGFAGLTGPVLAVSRTQNRIAFSLLRSVYYLDIAPAARPVRIATVENALNDISISDDGSVIAGCTTNRAVMAWDTKTKSLRFELRDHHQAVTAVNISSDGRTLASGDQSGVVKLRDLDTGQVFYELTDDLETVAQIEFAPDGKSLHCRSNADGEVTQFVARGPSDADE